MISLPGGERGYRMVSEAEEERPGWLPPEEAERLFVQGLSFAECTGATTARAEYGIDEGSFFLILGGFPSDEERFERAASAAVEMLG